MKYKKFHKFIEEQYAEKKQPMFKRIMDGLPFSAESMNAEIPVAATAAETPAAKPAAKRRTSFKHSFKNFFKQPARLAACVSAAVAVACLAIILPFTLNGNGLQTATTPTAEDRFCQAAACKEIELSYTLKEYSARNHLSLLYVDWYDIADIKTSLHVNKQVSTDIVYYEEILKHQGTGSIVELYVTDLYTKVDKVEDYKKGCDYVYVLKPFYTKVRFGIEKFENGEHSMHKAYFTYGKYEYVIVLRYPINKNSIFELVDSMLP